MNDDDLIRRGDAVQACQVGPSDEWSKSTRGGYNQAATDCAMNILRVPAVQPRMKPLVWLQHPTRLGELFAGAEFGAYSVSDPTGRGCWQWQWHLMGALLDQSNQELARAFPTRGDAIAAAEGHRKARILSALDNNTGKEVMPSVPVTDATNASDIGPGDQAVAGAAGLNAGEGATLITMHEGIVALTHCKSNQDACARGAEWEVNKTGSLDWHTVEGKAQVLWTHPPDPVAGAAQDGDVDAGLYDDGPEEIGILQARLEDQDRTIADLTRQLQGQPRRQSDVNADTWQPIATAPKDRVIDLWPAEGGRCADAIWDVSCGVEGWTDANDHRSLEGYSFTHWMDRPAGPTEGGA